MKVDGKFMINGDIPEGQASVNELLAECFDLAYELRVAAESEESGWNVTLWQWEICERLFRRMGIVSKGLEAVLEAGLLDVKHT